jgi:hypothetical protein
MTTGFDAWSLLVDELRIVLAADNNIPKVLLPTIADYVRSRFHAWQPAPDWRIDGKTAERIGDTLPWTVCGIRSLYRIDEGPTDWTIDITSSGVDFRKIRNKKSKKVFRNPKYVDDRNRRLALESQNQPGRRIRDRRRGIFTAACGCRCLASRRPDIIEVRPTISVLRVAGRIRRRIVGRCRRR